MPAAAVRRGVQALFGIIGRKACVGGFVSQDVKALGLTQEVHSILQSLSMGEGRGIPGVVVKYVDIWRNTGGEGGDLAQY